MNVEELKGRVDTLWEAKFGRQEEERPAWRALFEPSIDKAGRGLTVVGVAMLK